MSVLFQPAKIGNLTIKNRFVRAATAEGLADAEGRPTEPLVGLYRQLAQNEVGLIVTGHAFVCSMGRHSPTQTGIHQDENIPSLRKLAQALKGTESKVMVQISHAGRQSRPGVLKSQSVAPSAVPFGDGMYNPRAMSEEEIVETTEAFGQAARRAREAGFHGIDIHAAHGFLISQFLSPHTNRRNDAWGGDEDRRIRFLLEVYAKVREQVGMDYPVTMKLNGCDYLRNGLTIEMSARLAAQMAREGVDAITVSGGMQERDDTPRPKTWDLKSPEEEAYFRPSAEAIRKAVGNSPLLLVGGLRTPRIMEEIITSGVADFVALSRPFIMEPELVKKIKAGRQESVRCNTCNQCLGLSPLTCPPLNP